MQGEAPALFVRRKGADMPEDLSRGTQQAEQIDWCKSTLLNLVIQASFMLTVATCRSAMTHGQHIHCVSWLMGTFALAFGCMPSQHVT
jgi:hypothetical protein